MRKFIPCTLLLALSLLSARAQLAIKGDLLLAEDFASIPEYSKQATPDFLPLRDGWKVKVWHDGWTKTADGIRSHWESGHNPVIVYEGSVQDVVVELEFRFRREAGKNAYVRIGPMSRPAEPRAYAVSAWANVDSRARPPGVVLEYEQWRTQGYTSVATQIGSFQPDTWYSMRLEVVGDQALVTCNGITASGSFEKFGLPKTLIGIGVGHATHDLRHLRIYRARPNPAWKQPAPRAQTVTPIEAIPSLPQTPATREKIAQMAPLFDGQSLAGWTQLPAAPITLGREDILDARGFARRLSGHADPVSAFLYERLDPPAKAGLSAALAGSTDSRATIGPVVRCLNNALPVGTVLYDDMRFRGVALRPKTRELIGRHPTGLELARLNRLLLEDAFDGLIAKSPDETWVVKDGVLASTGAGRGVIYTHRDFESYRLVFQVRQKSGNHFPGVLLFCQRPPAGELGLDALGGIQFGVPSAGHWDYRPGINRAGDHFIRPLRVRYNPQEWAEVEILVDGKRGTARMAIAQPVGAHAIEVLDFSDPTAARSGPIALQMHNAQLFDEYRDVRIEVDPKEPDRLITLE